MRRNFGELTTPEVKNKVKKFGNTLNPVWNHVTRRLATCNATGYGFKGIRTVAKEIVRGTWYLYQLITKALEIRIAVTNST